jgi:hypothetical protein
LVIAVRTENKDRFSLRRASWKKDKSTRVGTGIDGVGCEEDVTIIDGVGCEEDVTIIDGVGCEEDVTG